MRFSRMTDRFPWRTALKIAWRESRSSPAKFLFVVLAVAVGVGSLTGVRSFSRAFRGTLLSEARTLMAADLTVRVFALPNPEQAAVLEQLEKRGVRRTWSPRPSPWCPRPRRAKSRCWSRSRPSIRRSIPSTARCASNRRARSAERLTDDDRGRLRGPADPPARERWAMPSGWADRTSASRAWWWKNRTA